MHGRTGRSMYLGDARRYAHMSSSKMAVTFIQCGKTIQVTAPVLVKSPNMKFNDDLFTGFPVALGLRSNRRKNFRRHTKRM